MRHVVILILLSCSLSGSWSALSANGSPELEKLKPTADKQICRREQTTGTILPGKKICKSKEEWLSIDGANAKAVENSKRGRSASLPPGAVN